MKRRKFLQGIAAGAVAAVASPLAALAGAGEPQKLSVVSRTLEVNGKAAKVFGLQRADGQPGLMFDAGETFDVELVNAIDEPTLVHWHGLSPPWVMDGVPDNPAPALKPGESRRYNFPVGEGGTHWMHAHTLQEQNLLAAPLIVRRAEDRARDEQEVVVMLHDFSFQSGEALIAKLKGGSSSTSRGGMMMNHGAMSGAQAQSMMAHMREMMQDRAMPGMGMMDANDIDFDAYLANDRTLDDAEVVAVEKGGRVRLRIINGSTATAYWVDLGALDGQLLAVDGQPVVPVTGRRFPISMGQRLDIALQLPSAGGALPILALREGARERSGLVLASAGASVAKFAPLGAEAAPSVGLDLESRLRARKPLAIRPPDRRFEVTLTGDMRDYAWGIVGGDALKAKVGERIEIAMTNMSMMGHPMHLHGHHFQVIEANGAPLAGAVRDTVHLSPMTSVTIAFDAANSGRWPFHCHNLYHMASGMMSFVAYEGVG